VSITDLLTLLNAFPTTAGQPGYLAAADYNSDGAVNITDLLAFLNDLGLSALVVTSQSSPAIAGFSAASGSIMGPPTSATSADDADSATLTPWQELAALTLGTDLTSHALPTFSRVAPLLIVGLASLQSSDKPPKTYTRDEK
jgi:hypothetical protein